MFKKSFPSSYVHATCMVRQAGETLVAYRRDYPNYSQQRCYNWRGMAICSPLLFLFSVYYFALKIASCPDRDSNKIQSGFCQAITRCTAPSHPCTCRPADGSQELGYYTALKRGRFDPLLDLAPSN